MKLGASGALLPVKGFQRIRHTQAESVLPPGGSMWMTTDGLLVSTSCSPMPLPQSGGKVGPTWLVEVSKNRGRPSDDDMRRVVECFAMPAFEEDNHFPGVTRALFCPVDEVYRGVCECKLTEKVIVEDDGFTWSDDGTGRQLLHDTLRLSDLRLLSADDNSPRRLQAGPSHS